MSMYVSVVISPATITRPVVTSVSQATRPSGSSVRTASRIVSDSWSATLSGWPSVTDSDVKRYSRSGMRAEAYLLDSQEPGEREVVAVLRAVHHQGAQWSEVVLVDLRDRAAVRLLVLEPVLDRLLRVGVEKPGRLVGDRGGRKRGFVRRVVG